MASSIIIIWSKLNQIELTFLAGKWDKISFLPHFSTKNSYTTTCKTISQKKGKQQSEEDFVHSVLIKSCNTWLRHNIANILPSGRGILFKTFYYRVVQKYVVDVDIPELSESPWPGFDIFWTSMGLGRQIVKELDLKLTLGMSERWLTGSPPDEESWGGGQWFKSRPDPKSPFPRRLGCLLTYCTLLLQLS